MEEYKDARDYIAARGKATKPIPQAKPKKRTFVIDFEDNGRSFSVDWTSHAPPTTEELQHLIGEARRATGRVGVGEYQDKPASAPIPQATTKFMGADAQGALKDRTRRGVMRPPTDTERELAKTDWNPKIKQDQLGNMSLMDLYTTFRDAKQTVSGENQSADVVNEATGRLGNTINQAMQYSPARALPFGGKTTEILSGMLAGGATSMPNAIANLRASDPKVQSAGLLELLTNVLGAGEWGGGLKAAERVVQKSPRGIPAKFEPKELAGYDPGVTPDLLSMGRTLPKEATDYDPGVTPNLLQEARNRKPEFPIKEATGYDPGVTPDLKLESFVNKRWRAYTEEMMRTMQGMIPRMGKQEGRQLGFVKNQLMKSLKDNMPHATVRAELEDLYRTSANNHVETGSVTPSTSAPARRPLPPKSIDPVVPPSVTNVTPEPTVAPVATMSNAEKNAFWKKYGSDNEALRAIADTHANSPDPKLRQAAEMARERLANRTGTTDLEGALQESIAARTPEVPQPQAVPEPTVAPAPPTPKGFMGQTRAFMLGGQSGDKATMKFASIQQRTYYDAYSRFKKKHESHDVQALASQLGVSEKEIINRASGVYDDVRSQMKGLADGDHVDLVDNVGVAPKKAEQVSQPPAVSQTGNQAIQETAKEPWQMTKGDATGFIRKILSEAEDHSKSHELPNYQWTSELKSSVEKAQREYDSANKAWERAPMPTPEMAKRRTVAKNKLDDLKARHEEASADNRSNADFLKQKERDYLLENYPDLFESRDKWPFVMGKGEYSNYTMYHKDVVKKALSEGKPVPPEVLADYPDLAAKYNPELSARADASIPAPETTATSTLRERIATRAAEARARTTALGEGGPTPLASGLDPEALMDFIYIAMDDIITLGGDAVAAMKKFAADHKGKLSDTDVEYIMRSAKRYVDSGTEPPQPGKAGIDDIPKSSGGEAVPQTDLFADPDFADMAYKPVRSTVGVKDIPNSAGGENVMQGDMFTPERFDPKLPKVDPYPKVDPDRKTFFGSARGVVRSFRLMSVVRRIADALENAGSSGIEVGLVKTQSPIWDMIIFPNARKLDGPANYWVSPSEVTSAVQHARLNYKNQALELLKEGNVAELEKYGVHREAPGPLKYVARATGLSDIGFTDFWHAVTTTEMSKNKRLSPDMVETLADDEGLLQIFANKNDIGDLLKDAERRNAGTELGQAKMLALDLAIPFPKILANVAGRASDYAIGSIKAGIKMLEKHPGKPLTIAQRRHINALMSRQMVGAAGIYAGYSLATNGAFTVTINEEDEYLDYPKWADTYGGAFGKAVLLGSSLYAIANSKGDAEKKRKYIIKALADLIDQPTISGAGRTTDILRARGDIEANIGKVMGRMLSTAVIPAEIRNWGTWFDDTRYQTKGFTDELKRAWPGTRKQLPVKGAKPETTGGGPSPRGIPVQGNAARGLPSPGRPTGR